MEEQQIIEILNAASGPEKKISCAEARRIAEATGAGNAVIGRLCNRLGIKIHSCELGCF